MNYFFGTVKILNKFVQNFNDGKILKLIFQVEMSQTRQNRLVSLIFWGNLANEVKDYYQINDYILIEGYSSIDNKNLKTEKKKPVKLIITVLKVYPFLLNSDQKQIND